MSWIIITAIAILTRAFYSISTRALSLNVKVSSNTQSVILPFYAALLSLLLIPFLGLNFEGLRESWWVAALLALSQGMGNILYFYGQKYIDSGMTQIALSSKLVWTAIMSVAFLGSNFNAVQIVGMILLLAGILLVQNTKHHNSDTKKGVLLISASAVVFSVFAVTGADIASKINPVAYLLVTYLGASLFAALVGRRDLVKDKEYISNNKVKLFKYFGYAAGTSTLYFTLIYYAYREASDAGIVAVLVNAQVVTTVIVASIILKERQNLTRKIIAGLVVIVSAYLISGI